MIRSNLYKECIGKIIREIRIEDFGMNVNAFSERLKKHRNTITNLESGKNITLDLLFLVCDELMIDPDDLFHLADKRYRNEFPLRM